MDSINQNQPEDNHKDFLGEAAGKKIKELADKMSSCYFCTKITTGRPLKVRPMSAQKVDDNGVFYFLSADDSRKNKDLVSDNSVHLLFQGSPHSDFLSIYGRGTVSKDKNLIQELWKPLMKNVVYGR